MGPVITYIQISHLSNATNDRRVGIARGRRGLSSLIADHNQNALDHSEAATNKV